MRLNIRRSETKTLAELEKLDDELVKKSAVLEQKIPVLQQRIDALKAAKRKPKRAKSWFAVLPTIRGKVPARPNPPAPASCRLIRLAFSPVSPTL